MDWVWRDNWMVVVRDIRLGEVLSVSDARWHAEFVTAVTLPPTRWLLGSIVIASFMASEVLYDD